MKIPGNLKALFFDMDGVLYDSMKNHALSWTKALESAGIKYSESATYQNEGRTAGGTIKLAFRKHLNIEVSDVEIDRIYHLKSSIIAGLPQAGLLPGMQLFINKLRQLPLQLIVVTGSKQPSLLQRLENDYGFNSQCVVSGKDVINEKPHPEPYLRALEKSSVLPHEAIVIENAPLGVTSGRNAGIFTVAVNTGPLPDKELWDAGANMVLPDTQNIMNQWDIIIAEYKRYTAKNQE
jgi:beta-phosphoglucomutase-like phosphatase (HAD superfamily)